MQERKGKEKEVGGLVGWVGERWIWCEENDMTDSRSEVIRKDRKDSGFELPLLHQNEYEPQKH